METCQMKVFLYQVTLSGYWLLGNDTLKRLVLHFRIKQMERRRVQRFNGTIIGHIQEKRLIMETSRTAN
jgi:ribosomal protein L19